jgi:dGTPase
MDLSDDIAYGVHDLEDTIALGLIKESAFRQIVTEQACEPFLGYLRETYPAQCGSDAYGYFLSQLFGTGRERKHTISRLVHYFLMNIEIFEVEALQEPLIRYRAQVAKEQERFLDVLQKLIVQRVICTPNVRHLEFKGQKMVVSVFEALKSDPRSLLPEDAFQRYDREQGDLRVICDYVAGMTDGFLLKTYERLFSPRMGSVFDKL